MDEKSMMSAESEKESAAEKDVQRRSILRSIPFFTALAMVTVIAWLLPLRPKVSDAEKRELKSFPAFSLTSLADGSYFEGIDDWFSDTFTFRDSWIQAAQNFKDHYGVRTVAIYGTATASDTVPVVEVTPKPETTATPRPTVSETPTEGETTEDAGEEKTSPEDETETVTQEGDFDSVWGGVTIGDEDFVGVGQVLQIGNAAFKITGFSQYYADLFIGYMNDAAEKLDGRANLYCLLVPEGSTYMLTAEDRLAYGFTLEEDVLNYIYSQMDERVHTVNPIPILVEHNDEYITFRTDHHWTALGAYYAYAAWCEAAGTEPVPLSDYEQIEWPGYLGTYYYKANRSYLMDATPDTVYAYVPPGDVHLFLNFEVTDKLGEEYDLLIDRSHSSAGGKYMTFLGSDSAKATFINNDITDGSACLVLKTSFGNPFVYYLTQHYQYVYVLDIRYLNRFTMDRFLNNCEVDDVLFVLGTGAAQSAGGTELTGWFINHK